MFRQSGRWAPLLADVRICWPAPPRCGVHRLSELRCGEGSGLPIARIRNAAGEFVKPSTKSISDVALAMESKMTDNFRTSLTNAPGKESYPI